MPLDGDLGEALGRQELPPSFERFRLVLEPGEHRLTGPGDWVGCLVLVERGVIEVDCESGGVRSFATGDLLALAWLPLRGLRNVGPDAACLLAVRRRADSSEVRIVQTRDDDPIPPETEP